MIFFISGFFQETMPPRPLITTLLGFWFLFWARRDIWILRFRNLTFRSLCRGKSYFSAAYAVETHNFPRDMPQKVETNNLPLKLSASYAAESHNFLQHMPQKVKLKVRISWRIRKKYQKPTRVTIRSQGGVVTWKKTEMKNLVTLYL